MYVYNNACLYEKRTATYEHVHVQWYTVVNEPNELGHVT